jgi:hypothetical protein
MQYLKKWCTVLKKLLDWGFCHNVWCWFHIIAGGIGAKVLHLYTDKWNALLFIVALAILWECFEFLYDGGIPGMIKIYGSVERWLYDCAGDIIGASFMALIVVG